MSASVPPPVADRYAAALARRSAALGGLSAQIDATLAPPPPRVLLVEDDEDSGAVLEVALRQAFAAAGRAVYVRLATDAEAAVEAARHEQWAAVVVDLHLGHPRLSGVDVVRALAPWTPFILVSGTVPEALPALAQRSRAHAHFAKPYDVEHVAACVAALLEAPASAAPR